MAMKYSVREQLSITTPLHPTHQNVCLGSESYERGDALYDTKTVFTAIPSLTYSCSHKMYQVSQLRTNSLTETLIDGVE